jgi:hypothetical protein
MKELNSLQLITFFLFHLHRHMPMLQQRSSGPRLSSSDIGHHHFGFQDPSLGESLIYASEKSLGKRWPTAPLNPTPPVEIGHHHLSFQDPALAESLFYPSEKKKSLVKRWPTVALDPTPPVEDMDKPAPEDPFPLLKEEKLNGP